MLFTLSALLLSDELGDAGGFLIMQDSTRHWTLHATFETDKEMKRQFEKIVGVPLKYEMLSCNPWRQNLLVACQYQTAAYSWLVMRSIWLYPRAGSGWTLAWRRHRSWLEARCHASGLGWSKTS